MCRGVVSVCPRHPWQVHPLSECKNPKIRLSVSLAGRVELPDFLSATGVDELSRSFASSLRGLPPCPQFLETDLSEASPSDWTSTAVTSFTFGKRIVGQVENWRVIQIQSRVVNAITSHRRGLKMEKCRQNFRFDTDIK